MSTEYEIIPDENLIINRYSGEFTAMELIDLRKKVSNDPGFKPDMLVIDDVSGVTSVNISTENLAELSEQSIVQSGTKRALVAETDLQYGMARMYQTYSESAGQVFMVFRNIDDAKNWLKESSR